VAHGKDLEFGGQNEIGESKQMIIVVVLAVLLLLATTLEAAFNAFVKK
jgi:hypothetical protein